MPTFEHPEGGRKRVVRLQSNVKTGKRKVTKKKSKDQNDFSLTDNHGEI